MKKTIKLAVCYAEGIMLVGFCIFQFAPGQVLSIFAASDAMLAIGIPAMRIICLHFFLCRLSAPRQSVLQMRRWMQPFCRQRSAPPYRPTGQRHSSPCESPDAVSSGKAS